MALLPPRIVFFTPFFFLDFFYLFLFFHPLVPSHTQFVLNGTPGFSLCLLFLLCGLLLQPGKVDPLLNAV